MWTPPRQREDNQILTTLATAITSANQYKTVSSRFALSRSYACWVAATGTTDAQGADISDHLWSAGLLADNPSLVEEAHLAYFRAGADVATTATYQASFEGFRVSTGMLAGRRSWPVFSPSHGQHC